MKFRGIDIVTEATRLNTCVALISKARVADMLDFVGKMSAKKDLRLFLNYNLQPKELEAYRVIKKCLN